MASETAARMSDTLLSSIIPSVGVTTEDGDTIFCIPSRGQIARVLISFGVAPLNDWVADIVTARGTIVGALDTEKADGFANIGADQVVAWDIDLTDEFNHLEPGDVVQLVTTNVTTPGVANVTLVMRP